ncbi:vacuolar ATPase assembly protein VMA22-like [Saccoglossus kowalevskii]|uniref:Vacuolar ATPase assembly protein VMA22 n=1 Tax=Saccoglossus kowalevskii TaxID=10224 RepID=A0ABM0H1V8_SACKO|nr:PREDICTED: coiled-coil domain-containing protein 115-like [Saccoglossus kowalevskii]
MEDICKRLDELVVQYFSALEKLTDTREQLQTLMKEGYFRLSKARYSMGNKAVSSLQYDANKMKALATITVSQDDDIPRFEVVRKKAATTRRKSSTSEDEHRSNIGTSEVRKRKGGDEVSAIKLKDMTLDDDEETIADPLRWFGVLVPGTLRQGQMSFIGAVEVSVELVNLQSELLTIQLKYKELLMKKRELMKKGEAVENTNSVDQDVK